VSAFTEKFGNVYFLLIRKEVNRSQYRELREASGLRPIETYEVFHFLLLHETYHYLHNQFHQDLRDPGTVASVAYAIQEYNANRWAGSELASWMNTESKGEYHETSL